MDLTFQVPMQYCSLQHWTLLLSPVTSTAGYCFCFGSIPSFFLELFLHWACCDSWGRKEPDTTAPLNWTDAVLLFTASDLASITSHIHSWVLFLLWLHPFILSGVISPLISSSILGTYSPREFIFQCYLFAFSYCSWDSQGKNTEVVCHSLLQWTTFCQTSPPWPARLGWPHRHG